MKKEMTLCNSIVFLILLGLLIWVISLNMQVEKLTRNNNELVQKIRYEHVEDLEMLPCPVCGKEGRILDGNDKYYIRCQSCGYETYAYNTVQEAIDTWNKISENKSRQN